MRGGGSTNPVAQLTRLSPTHDNFICGQDVLNVVTKD